MSYRPEISRYYSLRSQLLDVIDIVCNTAMYFGRVSVHFVEVAGSSKPQTTILMKFEGSVMRREARLKAAGV